MTFWQKNGNIRNSTRFSWFKHPVNAMSLRQIDFKLETDDRHIAFRQVIVESMPTPNYPAANITGERTIVVWRVTWLYGNSCIFLDLVNWPLARKRRKISVPKFLYCNNCDLYYLSVIDVYGLKCVVLCFFSVA